MRKERKLEDSSSKIDTEPKIHEFTADTALQVLLDPNIVTLLDFLNIFLTNEFFQLISGQKNLYAESYIEANPENPTSKTLSPTTPNEIKLFLALYLLTGIVRKPQIKQFWSTNQLLQTALFNQVMARSRFTEALKFLHFVDKSDHNTNDPNRDKLYKVRDIVEFLVDQFKNVWIPTQQISIDKEPLLWKGRLSLKQYIPSKRLGFGVKFVSLCEDSGYKWNSFVYLGKNPGNDNEDLELKNRIGKTSVIVVSLVKDLFGLDYTLHVDEWYTSEALFNYLYENQTCATGTARKNRMQLPNSFINEKSKKREFSFRRNENMLALRYQDKKEIYMLSTMHKADTINVRRRNWREDNIIQKTKVIDNYNQKMGGVDKNDAIIGNYSCIHKSYKWYIKIFFHYLEEAIFNAFIIYKNYLPQPKYTFMGCKLEIIRSMLGDAGSHVEPSSEFDPLKGWHFAEVIPATEKKGKSQKRCVVCWKRKVRKESRNQCSQCDDHPRLCPTPCFMIYHTKAIC